VQIRNTNTAKQIGMGPTGQLLAACTMDDFTHVGSAAEAANLNALNAFKLAASAALTAATGGRGPSQAILPLSDPPGPLLHTARELGAHLCAYGHSGFAAFSLSVPPDFQVKFGSIAECASLLRRSFRLPILLRLAAAVFQHSGWHVQVACRLSNRLATIRRG
jgi:hypothetical protein